MSERAAGQLWLRHRQNACYKRPDFIELAASFGITFERELQGLDAFDRQKDAFATMIDRSMLSEEAKGAYLALYEDRSRAIRT